MKEIGFDLLSAGAFHQDGYVCLGGPGHAVFDKETKRFLRMEPLGGIQQDQRTTTETPPAIATKEDIPLYQGNGG